jgi:peroxiredoxin
VLASYGYRFGGKLKPRATVAPFPVPISGEPFRPFRLKTLDGTEKSLPDVLGKKATLVVFFYPTCKYCNIAAPDIQKMNDTYSPQGLSVVYVNIIPEEQALVAKWQADHGYTAPVLVGGNLDEIQRDYGVEGTPTHYLLDGEGKILSKHSGFRAGDEKGLEVEIQRAVGAAGGTR